MIRHIAIYLFLFIFLSNLYSGEISLYTQSKLSQNKSKILKNSNGDEEKHPCYIQISKQSVLNEIENLGLNINSIIGDRITLNIPQSLITTLANIEGVERIELGTPIFTTLDKAREYSETNSVHNGIELPSEYTGKGVIVGIIDQGIQLDHLNFYNTHGELRIKRFWNQTDQQGTAPVGFDYGSEYTTQSEIESIKYDTDNGTHGIHVTGIAAGGYKGCDYYGVATESDIVFVSYNGYTASISDAISYIYNYADEVGKPAVINISIGGSIGPRDGTSDFDIIADELQGEGKILVGAAGNSGNKNLHVSKTLATNNDKLRTFMPCSYKLSNYSSQNIDYIEVYGESNTHLNLSLSLYNKQTNSYESTSSVVSTKFWNSTIYTINSGIVGTIEVYSEILQNTNKPHILIVKSLTQSSSNYAIEMNISSSKNNTIHAWSYMDTFDNLGYVSHTNGDSNYSVNEVGGTGKRILTVGSYVSKDIFGGTVGDISLISSKGPTVDGRTKPNITAAGEGVISSYSNSPNISQSSYYKPYLDFGTTINDNNQTYYYGAMSGTSMSAPIVTGIIALWLEARPTLTPEEIKEIIVKSAITDEYTGDISQPSNTWGYGKIDAWAGIKECLVLNSFDETESLTDKTIIVKNSREGETLNLLFTKNFNNTEIKIYDIGGKLLYINKISQIISGDEFIIETKNYKKGIYIINVIGDRISETLKVGLN